MRPIPTVSATLCILAAAGPVLSAAEPTGAKGLRPSTPEEEAWDRRHAIRTTGVAPTALAWDRYRAEAQRRGVAVAMARPALAAAGAEISGATADGSRVLAAEGTVSVLPRAVDNSAEKWFPPVRSQGGLGSCVAFSQTYYGMTYMMSRARDVDARTTDHATKASPRFTYNIANGGSDSGLGMSSALQVLLRYGAPTWAQFPYTSDFKGLPTTAPVWRSALGNRISEYGKLGQLEWSSVQDQVKQILANGDLVYYATLIDGWKFQVIKDDPSTTADQAAVGTKGVTHLANASGAHAMVIVGYNDDVWVDINANDRVDPYERGAFKIVNSWGTGWGTGGFAHIAYDALNEVSLVEGAPYTDSTGRSVSSPLWSLYWARIRDRPEPELVAEIDLTTANRNDLQLSWNAGPVGATAKPDPDDADKPWLRWASNDRQSSMLGNVAIDGLTGQRPATIALDWSPVRRGGGTVRCLLSAIDHNGPSLLRGLRLYDGAGTLLGSAVATQPAVGIPATFGTAAGRTAVTTWVDVTLPDPAPPAPVQGLSVAGVRPGAVRVAWRASGDDGDRGLATAYEVRWSDRAIDAGNPGTPVAAVPELRLPSGSALSEEITGLTAGRTYWFSVRARDDAGRWSDPAPAVQAVVPVPLTLASGSLAGAVGSPVDGDLVAAGGHGQLLHAVVPALSESVAAGGTPPAGGRDTTTRARALVLPFPFPFPDGDRIRTTDRLVVGRNGYATVSIPTVISGPREDASGFTVRHTWQAWGRTMAFRTSEEGIFVERTPDRVSVRWRASPADATGQDGSVSISMSFHPDGTVRVVYGSLPTGGMGLVGWRTPALPGDGWWRSGASDRPAPAPGTVLTWRPVWLPDGLSLDPGTGRITGTPLVAASGTIAVQVTDRSTPAQRAQAVLDLAIAGGGAVNQPPAWTAGPLAAPGVLALP